MPKTKVLKSPSEKDLKKPQWGIRLLMMFLTALPMVCFLAYTWYHHHINEQPPMALPDGIMRNVVGIYGLLAFWMVFAWGLQPIFKLIGKVLGPLKITVTLVCGMVHLLLWAGIFFLGTQVALIMAEKDTSAFDDALYQALKPIEEQNGGYIKSVMGKAEKRLEGLGVTSQNRVVVQPKTKPKKKKTPPKKTDPIPEPEPSPIFMNVDQAMALDIDSSDYRVLDAALNKLEVSADATFRKALKSKDLGKYKTALDRYTKARAVLNRMRELQPAEHLNKRMNLLKSKLIQAKKTPIAAH